MNKKTKKNDFHLIPSEETRCIWMNAGVLSYQLCDRKFECERCQLDSALRKKFIHKTTSVKNINLTIDQKNFGTLRPGYYYTTNHYWVKKIYNDCYRIGLDPLFSKALLPAKAVVLPAIGQQLTFNVTAGWFIAQYGTFPFLSPLSGKVIEINPMLSFNPQEIYKNPFESGWIFEITSTAEEFQQSKLLSFEESEVKNKKDERLFHDELLHALHDKNPEVGNTLADGGLPLQNVSDIIGHDKYYKVIQNIFIRH